MKTISSKAIIILFWVFLSSVLNAQQDTLSFNYFQPQIITAQPANSTISFGQNTTFAVVATGLSLAYQWQLSTDNGSTWNNQGNTGVYSNMAIATMSITAVTMEMNAYKYRCVVSGSCATAVASNAATLTVNKANQTITFGSLPAKIYGDVPYNLSATASSGLTVNYESSNVSVATVSGNTVTIVGAGTSTIIAKQAGDNNYNAAPDVPQALTVNKADQQITFNPLSPVSFSDTLITLTGVSNSGLTLNYQSSNTSVATISGNTVDIKNQGITNIIASQSGNSNYNAASNVVQPLYVIGLCVVRYDNSENKNMIVWEKPVTTKISAFKVYKEFGSDNYIPVTTVQYNKYSVAIDSSSDPDAHADRYKISVVDSLGKESQMSYFHKTPHIIFIGSNVFLQDNYQDESGLFKPSFFYIYRGNNKSTLILHDSISGTLVTYSDPKFTGGNMFYQVGIKRTPDCVPTGLLKAEIGPYTQSLSNIVEYKGSKLVSDGIIEAEIFPNPANDIVTIITVSHGVLSLTDVSGKIIKTINITANETKLDITELPAGCYIISIQSADGFVTSKLIVE